MLDHLSEYLVRDNKRLVGTLRSLLEVYRAPSGLLFSVATDLYESLNTPISLSCEILLRYGEIEQLVRRSVDPLNYTTASRFADDQQAVCFLKKAPLKIEGVDTEQAAKGSFLAAEVKCAETNARIRAFARNPITGASPVVARVITHAIGKIASVLGPAPRPREWLYACRFGPGTFQHTQAKGLTSLYDKLQVQPSVTHDMKDVAALLVMSQPQWARSVTDSEVDGFWPLIRDSDFDLVPGNKVAFVPKTAVTDRTIAIEPLMNIFAQLGLGTLMRKRLRSVGIDLDDQSPNQRAALAGSVTGQLATLDLSMASDTVSKELVRLFLPDGWFSALDLCRSKNGYLDGKWFRYEKFSSMGNGYTFELETLIFWGLMHGVCTELMIKADKVLVYGDDIVIPVPAYALAVEVLEFCGFSPNKAKSYALGPFRESCGKDYFNRTDVRPFFQKEVPYEIEHLFRFANGIRMLAHRRNNFIGCDARLRRPWDTILRSIPRPIRDNVCVPGHAGDSDGIKVNWDESQRSPLIISNKDGWEGISGVRYQAVPREGSRPGNLLGVVASQLYRLSDGGKLIFQQLGSFKSHDEKIRWLAEIEDSVSASPRQERGCTYRLRVGAFFGPWTDLGPWS
jgi:hypothetical protein